MIRKAYTVFSRVSHCTCVINKLSKSYSCVTTHFIDVSNSVFVFVLNHIVGYSNYGNVLVM